MSLENWQSKDKSGYNSHKAKVILLSQHLEHISKHWFCSLWPMAIKSGSCHLNWMSGVENIGGPSQDTLLCLPS